MSSPGVRFKRSLRSTASLLVLAAVLSASPALAGIAWSGQAPPAVERARELMKRLESKSPSSDPDSLLKMMNSADLELSAHLKAHGGEPEDVILLMRIHDAQSMALSFLSLLSGRLEPTTPLPEPHMSIVEAALLNDSLNAELHYWKGRLCSLPQMAGRRPLGIPRLGEAIHEARTAVAIDSTQPMFRDFLAFLLYVNGQESAARSMFRQLDPNHPMYLLLHDWERMPAVEGTVRMDDSTRFLAPYGSPLAYTFAGMIRTHVFRGTAAAFETSCRKHWPSFRLLLDPDTKRQPPGVRRFAQHLRWKGDTLEPDAVQSDVSGGTEPGVGGGGIWVEVLESRALATDPATAHPGVQPGEIYCRVGFHNKR